MRTDEKYGIKSTYNVEIFDCTGAVETGEKHIREMITELISEMKRDKKVTWLCRSTGNTAVIAMKSPYDELVDVIIARNYTHFMFHSKKFRQEEQQYVE